MKQQRFYLLTTLRADPAGLGRTGSFQLHRRGLLVRSWRNQDGFLLVPSIHRRLSVHPLTLSHRIAALRAVTQRSEKAKEDATSSPDAEILEFTCSATVAGNLLCITRGSGLWRYETNRRDEFSACVGSAFSSCTVR